MTKKNKTVQERLDKQSDVASLVSAYIESYGLDGGAVFRGFWRPKVDYNVGEYVADRHGMLRCKKSHRSYLREYGDSSYLREYWEGWHGWCLSHDWKQWLNEDEAKLAAMYDRELEDLEAEYVRLSREQIDLEKARTKFKGMWFWQVREYGPASAEEIRIVEKMDNMDEKKEAVHRKIIDLRQSTGLFKPEEKDKE